MFDSDSTYALLLTLTPYSYWGRPGGSAEHGSPYDYDAHVPMIFYGPAFRPGRYTERVRVVDMAPTLARMAGVKPTQRIGGRVITSNQALRLDEVPRGVVVLGGGVIGVEFASVFKSPSAPT